MIKSMTGFGRAEQTVGDKSYLVEVRSLNGKQFELQLKIPPLLKPFEFEIRNLLQANLFRGTIDCFITIRQHGAAKPVVVNTDLIRAYHQQLTALANELNLDTQALLSALLRLPEVVSPSTEVMDPREFDAFKSVLNDALNELNQHRLTEGSSISKDLRQRIQNIEAQEKNILELEPRRATRIREEINQLLEKNVGKDNVDNNRMEQELIYYLEKIDIHEEQIRLRQHCEYFLSTMDGDAAGKGKKLSFILQEIGREINTTGSKAYDADIQRCVVIMKDELEKAKEQVLNVL